MIRKYYFALILATLIFLTLLFGQTTIYQLSSEATKLFSEPKEIFSNLTEPNALVVTNITRSTPQKIEILLSKPLNISGVEFYFPGNFHNTSSYLAEDFDVIAETEFGSSYIEVVRGNRKSSFRKTLQEELETKKIEIILHKAAFDNAVAIKNFNLLERKQVNFLFAMKDYVSRHNESFPFYIIYSAIFYILVYVSGYGLAQLMQQYRRRNISPENKLAFGPVIFLSILAVSAMVYYFLGIELALYIPFLLFILAGYAFLKDRLYKNLGELKFILFITIIATLVSTVVQAQRDFLVNLPYIEQYLVEQKYPPDCRGGGYYGYHIDNTRSWGIARIILNRVELDSEETEYYLLGHEKASIFDRTPMLALITAPILKMFGESHFIYQRFTNVLVSLYFCSVYILIKRYLNTNTAKKVSLLMLMNVPFLFMAFSTEVHLKYIAFYPAILALAILKRPHIPFYIIGLLLAMSLFIHPLAMIIIASVGIYYLSRLKGINNIIYGYIISFSPSIITFILWTTFSNNYLVSGSLSSNIYAQSLSNIPKQFIADKIFNLINLFLPDYTLTYHENFTSLAYFRNLLSRSLVFAITPVLAIFFILKTKNVISNVKYRQALWFILTPLALFLLVYSGTSYGIFSAIYPLIIPLILGIIVREMTAKSTKVKLFLLFSYFFFMSLELYFLSGIFIEFNHKSDIVWLCFLLALSLFTLIIMSVLKLERSNQILPKA